MLIGVAMVKYLPVNGGKAAVTAGIGIGTEDIMPSQPAAPVSEVVSVANVLPEEESGEAVIVSENMNVLATPKYTDDWRLILVNTDYHIPEDYSVNLKTLRNDYRVDKRIYPDLQRMFDDARYDGVFPLIMSAYRTAEYQQKLLDNKLSELAQQGMTGDAAMKEALMWVAAPGTSEHQLGLAIDVESEEGSEQLQEVYDWMEQNSWRYGFIRRYPEDKSEITGINYEPWHYRYVGKEAAKEIFESGICLEEYLGVA